MSIRRLHAAAMLAACVSTGAYAQQKTLKVGDAAPPLSVAEGVQGDVAGLQSGKVNLVEFWATWCGPCRKSIPKLDELHDDLAGKGLVVIGVSDEKPEVVKPFVRSRGGGMSYPVAIDQNKQTNQAWMKAAGRDGIPAAFLVSRDGKIAWIGHPADPAMLEIIPKLLAGKYDPVLEKQAAPLLDAANKAASRRNYRQAYTHLDKVIEMDPKVFSSVVLQRYELMLTGEKDTEAATAYLSTKIEEYGPDAGSLTEFATALVNDPDLRPRNLELAAAAAEAVNAAAPNQPDSLAVLAMVQFAQGDATAAIENQQRAWMMADPSVKAEFKKALDQYRTTARRSSSR
jgi:thiol-disulfide isomerase/thioredoxin